MALLSGIRDRLFYGWVVVAAAFVLSAVIFGTRYSFGVFFKSLERDFELTRAATSGVFSVYMTVAIAFAVLGGWALDRYGPRIIVLLMGVFTGLSLILTSRASLPWHLFTSYGLLFAIGTGAAYTVLMSTTSRWFDRKRGLALGIVSAGTGLGTVVMAPFATYLIANFGWRMAFIIIGIIAGLVIVSLANLLKKDPGDIGALPDGTKLDYGEVKGQSGGDGAQPPDFSLRQALGTRSFWLLAATWFLWSTCLHFVLTHIVPHAIDLGVSAGEASLVLGLIGLISVPSRLITGWVSDRTGRKASAVICALLQAGAMLWLIWAQELWMLYVFAVIFGVGYGGFDPTTVALVGDTFGLRNLGMVMGVLVLGWGMGAAIGPAAGGLIYDVSQSYFVAFLMGALLMLAAALLVSFIRREVAGTPDH